MLTIKYRDYRCSETIIPGVKSVSWHEGALTAQLAGEESVTFGPNFRHQTAVPEETPVAFVMNEAGATVARYEFYPRPFPDEVLAQCQADPDRLAA